MNRRILWDCHMHSSFSADSPAPMEDMIRQAVFLGLQGITFTEHLDPDYPATPDGLDFSLDIPSYQEKLFQLQDTYNPDTLRHRTWPAEAFSRLFSFAYAGISF